VSRGTGTTLILHPEGLADITFDQSARTGSSEGYFVQADSLRFNEEKRIEIVYGGEGGEFPTPVDEAANLADVTFTAVINSATWAGMMAKLETLQLAVHNAAGGTLEYLPEGAAAGTRSTYYHYVQSPIPALRQHKRNRPDRGSGSSGVFRLEVDVTLRTWPVATSDPDSLVEVLSATTVYNIYDGGQDYVTIDGDDVVGSLPALVRFQVTPGAGDAASIGRLWMARRTEGLDNFDPTHLSSESVHISDSSVWSSVIDGDRCGNNYVRCTPEQHEIEYGRRFTVPNWSDHRGRAAIGAIVRANTGDVNDWSIYYGWTIGNTVQRGKAQYVPQVREWRALLLGEFDLPDTEMSEAEDLDLYVDVYTTRHDGEGTLSIDAIKLLYTDECALQMETPTGYGVDSDHQLLIENVSGDEIAHAVDSSLKLTYLLTAKGNFPTLSPGMDNRFDLLWERYREAAIEEDFADYDHLWQSIAHFDDSATEPWTGGSIVSWDTDAGVDLHEGAGALLLNPDGSGNVTAECELPARVDIGGFEDGDFICLTFRLIGSTPSSGTLRIRFYTDGGVLDNYFEKTHTLSLPASMNEILSAKRSEYSVTQSPAWDSIDTIQIHIDLTGGTPSAMNIYLDDLRIVKADPEDTDTYSCLTPNWAGETDKVFVATYGGETFIQAREYSSTVYIWRATNPTFNDAKVWMKVWTASPASGYPGMWFRATDLTDGSEDGYRAQETMNRPKLVKYTAGSDTELIAGRSHLPDREWHYFGVIVKDGSWQLYSSASLEDLFSRLAGTVADTDHDGYMFGLDVDDPYMRYAKLRIEHIKDIHIPTDTVSVQVHALFRTIYPFYE